MRLAFLSGKVFQSTEKLRATLTYFSSALLIDMLLGFKFRGVETDGYTAG